jgi:hypothetical protein
MSETVLLTVTCSRDHEWDAWGETNDRGTRLTDHAECPTCREMGHRTVVVDAVERESLA